MSKQKPQTLAWPVKPECPAPDHNTLRAVKGRGYRDSEQPRCICDHGLELLQREREARRRAARAVNLADKTIAGDAGPRPRQVRDTPASMANGACTSALGILIMDRLLEKSSPSAGDLSNAKTLCDGCPARADCLDYITEVEQPPGSWPGMYGGLTRTERRKLAAA